VSPRRRSPLKIGRTALVVGALIVGASSLLAQDTVLAATSQKLRVFLDCSSCDQDYLKQQVTFVDYVRDQHDAQVHVLITDRSAASGKEYTLRFMGVDARGGQDQVLTCTIGDTESENERQQVVAKTLAFGLLRYVAGTSLVRDIQVKYSAAQTVASTQKDPWNFWIFRTSVDGRANKQQSSSSLSGNASVNASRVTEQWKTTLNVQGRYQKDTYILDDSSQVINALKDYYGNGELVKSVGPHWGVGISGGITRSRHFKLRQDFHGEASAEYNIFPYAESSERAFTISYFIGAKHVQYFEETVLGKTREAIFAEGLSSSISLKRSWGEVQGRASFSHDNAFSQSQIMLYGSLRWRLMRGLSFDLSTNAQRVQDQIYLPKSGLSPDEILLGSRARKTGFRYSVGAGLTYTFGSIHNTVVNSRL